MINKYMLKFVKTKAEAARKTTQMYSEDQAVQAVLKASREATLKADLDKLAKKTLSF